MLPSIQCAHHLFINHTCFSIENFPFFSLGSETRRNPLRYPGKMDNSLSWAVKDAADTQLMVLEAFVMSQTENKSVLDTEPASASPFQMQSFSQLYLAVKTSGFSSHGSYQKKHRQHQLKSPFRNHLLCTHCRYIFPLPRCGSYRLKMPQIISAVKREKCRTAAWEINQ